jgi:hypothetical protein
MRWHTPACGEILRFWKHTKPASKYTNLRANTAHRFSFAMSQHNDGDNRLHDGSHRRKSKCFNGFAR